MRGPRQGRRLYRRPAGVEEPLRGEALRHFFWADHGNVSSRVLKYLPDRDSRQHRNVRIFGRLPDFLTIDDSWSVDVAPDGGVSKQAMEETKTALRELGLKDELL